MSLDSRRIARQGRRRLLRRASAASVGSRPQWTAALSSGAIAGLAGVCQVLGVQHHHRSIAAGYGCIGIVVASLGVLTAGGVLLVGLLLGTSPSAPRTPRRPADPPADGRHRHRRAAADRRLGDDAAQLPDRVAEVSRECLVVAVDGDVRHRHADGLRRPRGDPRRADRGAQPGHRGDHVRRRARYFSPPRSRVRCSASSPLSPTAPPPGR